ncbi:hypothetical protein JCM15519_27510 [Fundidesulfovibrio butyratiphilus]
MKRKTPNHMGRGLREMGPDTPFLANQTRAVKAFLVPLAACECAPAVLADFLAHTLHLGVA